MQDIDEDLHIRQLGVLISEMQQLDVKIEPTLGLSIGLLAEDGLSRGLGLHSNVYWDDINKPEIGKRGAVQLGVSSGREWYSRWNCMKELVIESVGKGVDDMKEGDHVLTIFNGECGECAYCLVQ
ncbi:groES-like zinc-binding dehydrogenase family protein [Artemisia annua]|uniref:GroES-like zinc-binding dehydrogenase family protein n=1 Tax=Artemisia annua TaxID=35608 RepID=A0A2U1MPJ6_ARTAN|nr:groES-like zinc-binding dehydrogenase family protein [Artemisia annua]